MLVEYGLGSGHLRFYLAPKVSYRSRNCILVLVAVRANVGFLHRLAMKSKRVRWRLRGIEVMLKTKPHDDQEDLAEETTSIASLTGVYKMFTIIYIFSGRDFGIVIISKPDSTSSPSILRSIGVRTTFS